MDGTDYPWYTIEKYKFYEVLSYITAPALHTPGVIEIRHLPIRGPVRDPAGHLPGGGHAVAGAGPVFALAHGRTIDVQPPPGEQLEKAEDAIKLVGGSVPGETPLKVVLDPAL